MSLILNVSYPQSLRQSCQSLWLLATSSVCLTHLLWDIPHCTYTLLISEHNAPAVIHIRSPFPSVILVWVCGQMGYGPDLIMATKPLLKPFLYNMSASLTSAAPLYCSSINTLYFCESEQKSDSLVKYPLWSFELVWCVLLFSLTRYIWRWQPFVEIANSIMEDTIHNTLLAVFRLFRDSSLNPQ